MNSLEAAQIEYDIGNEQILRSRHGSRQEPHRGPTQLQHCRRRTNNRKYFEEHLRQHLANGGITICCGKAPTRIDGSESDTRQSVVPSTGWQMIDATQLPAKLASRASDQLTIQRTANDSGILFHQRRQLDDGELLFLVNTSITTNSTGVIYSTHLHSIEQWDLNTAKSSPIRQQFNKTVLPRSSF